MSFKDSFDRIVSDIERLVEFDEDYGYLKAPKIIENLCQQHGKTARDLSTIFEFITGKTLSRYVKDRKMMATYRKMMKDDNYDVESYKDCSGYENEPTFITAFSDKFGISPKKAFQLRDNSKIEEPISLEQLLSTSDKPEVITTPEIVFGLPKDIVDRYNNILEYQAMFGLEEKHVELAVFLSEEKGLPLQAAFETVETLVTDYKEIIQRDTLKSMLFYIDTVVPAVYIKHLYPDVCLPELNNWYFIMRDEGGNALKETPEFVRAFIDDVSDGFSYVKLKELYKDYTKNYTEDFSFKEYLETVQEYGSIEARDEFLDSVMKEDNDDRIYDGSIEEESFWAAYDEKHFKNM